MFTNRGAARLLGVLAGLFLSVNPLTGKLVHVISSHDDSYFSSYNELENGAMEFQRQTQLDFGYGAVGLALDPNSQTLFASYEGALKIALFNAQTLQNLDVINTPMILSGLAYDKSRSKLYGLGRYDKNLYIYDWNPATHTLTYDTLVALPNMTGSNNGYGLALDEKEGLLYVSNMDGVYYYDTTDWSFEGYFAMNTGSESYYAIGIAVYNDGSGKRYLYAGGYSVGAYLMRVDLDKTDDPSKFLKYDCGVDEGVIGLTVDKETCTVYVTTWNNDIRVFDHYVFPSAPRYTRYDVVEENDPADICMAGDVEYRAPILIEKDHEYNCILEDPNFELTYTLSLSYQWNEPNDSAVTDFERISVIDTLPEKMEFISADPDNYVYDSTKHTVTWRVDPNTFSASDEYEVVVQNAQGLLLQGDSVQNVASVILVTPDGTTYGDITVNDTWVCNVEEIFYVDIDANPSGDGTSWDTAFDNLQDALGEARTDDEIWVAEGVYMPTAVIDADASFELANAVKVLGGFAGNETASYQRDWWTNPTVLCGDPNGLSAADVGNYDIDEINVENCNHVVSIGTDVDWAVLDGFVIRKGRQAGIYAQAGEAIIQHCQVVQNKTGIICTYNAAPTIKNNLIFSNQIGLKIDNCHAQPLVRNNTLAANEYRGLDARDNDVPPTVHSCIFWSNSAGTDPNDVAGCDVTYSCLEYPQHYWQEIPGDPNNPIYLGIGQGNIGGDPNDPDFADATEFDYRLTSTSPCIDTGNPSADWSTERDIERTYRILGDRVDMGADEFCTAEHGPGAADVNDDGIVNLEDAGLLAAAWLSTPGDPNNWQSDCDLDEDSQIDKDDLLLLTADWLAADCEQMASMPLNESEYGGMMAGMAMESFSVEAALEPDADMLIDWLNLLWANNASLRAMYDADDWLEFINELRESE